MASFDRTGRLKFEYLTDGGGDTGYSHADDVTSDAVLEQTEWSYDLDSNLIFETMRQRFHDETGTGALGIPSRDCGAKR